MFNRFGYGIKKSQMDKPPFGLRGQSEAATPLWQFVSPYAGVRKRRRRYALPAQSKFARNPAERWREIRTSVRLSVFLKGTLAVNLQYGALSVF